ncbi:hypothetical protein [Bradyrhizobium sp. CCBAU 53421]|uniref:hypothetical protein n=1 Tax=Bradyrhizobium sp. CCBAU 53421 TaxID=1325120 RepID=UPI00188AA6F3|nr:hypothetical protein XH92_36505 [Bradyrhizobium sp. CCBAU 53421]
MGRALAELEMQLLRRFKLEAACTPCPIAGVLLQPDRDVLAEQLDLWLAGGARMQAAACRPEREPGCLSTQRRQLHHRGSVINKIGRSSTS